MNVLHLSAGMATCPYCNARVATNHLSDHITKVHPRPKQPPMQPRLKDPKRPSAKPSVPTIAASSGTGPRKDASGDIRPTAASELKHANAILAADPAGWNALHAALVHAAKTAARRPMLDLALAAVKAVLDSGFRSRVDDRATRFLGKPVMAFQDALFVVNELRDWRFPDELLLVAWLVECGGPEMGRGPARASFQKGTPAQYIAGARALYNAGKHGNGDGWPPSHRWAAADCRHVRRTGA